MRFSAAVRRCGMAQAIRKTLAGVLSLTLVAAQVLTVIPHHAEAAVSDWTRGSSVNPRWDTDFGSDSFRRSLADLKAAGANTVSLIIPIYQSNTGSTEINRGWNTPTDASLALGIQQARALGLKVNIKIHLESYDGAWRANINPGDRAGWFRNYTNWLVHFGRIAQANNAEMMTLGTELVSMAAHPMHSENTARWVNLIGAVRAVYSGKLTYSANSNDNGDNPFLNEKKYIAFWNQLDTASISAYYTLNSDSSVEGMKSAWNHWNNNDLRAFAQTAGKPLMIGELGYRSIQNAHAAPWDYSNASGRLGGPSEQEQADAYEALFSYWNDYPYMTGVNLWDWSSNPDAGGPGNTDYTPQNKQAEQVMTRWFTNPSTPGVPNTGTNDTPTFDATGTANPSGTNVGSTVTLNAAIKATTGAASNTIVDLEVYDSSNNKVHQQFYENQQFAAGETRNFPTQWTPQAAGTYRLAVGVFSGGWASAYYWKNSAITVTVGSGSTPPPNPPPPNNPPPATTTPPTNNPPPPPPPNGTATIQIWWPTNGVTVSGVQPLKAIVEGREVSTYQMYWQVDGGNKVVMFNSPEDYPHKEAWVDFTGWNWKGRGPYTLTFTAEVNGQVIGQKSIEIYTQ
jgi:hypothetical protein